MLWHNTHYFTSIANVSLFIWFQAHGIPSVKNYNYKKNLNWTSNDTTVGQELLFNMVTYSVNEIIKLLSVRTIFADGHGRYTFEVDISKKQESLIEQRHRSFGRCYTFHPEKKLRDLGIYYIKAEL